MVVERAQAALDDIVALAAEKPVAVFAHGAIGRVMRGLFLRAPKPTSWRWTSRRTPSFACIAARSIASPAEAWPSSRSTT